MAKWLQESQHDVYSVYEEIRGSDDNQILQEANHSERILITNDKDFGEMIFREKKPHRGVILLRLADERPNNKIRIIEELLNQHGESLINNVIVATETSVRINSITNV